MQLKFSNYCSSSSMPNSTIKFIDLFAGMGGTRVGFEKAIEEKGLESQCVFTSEIKNHAKKAYLQNFPETDIEGDITLIQAEFIPDFDYMLAGFPCQPFSTAGTRKGFMDERGGLFFTIYEILKCKNPEGFLLENVDGLVTHNNGETMALMLKKLKELGYYVSYRILDSSEFNIPQRRKRVYIIGSKSNEPNFAPYTVKRRCAGDCIDYNYQFSETEFCQKLSNKYTARELEGKSIKDKRGGKNNIHAWDLELKGTVSKRQNRLLSEIIRKRRYKKWAELKGIKWMDGMPLTKGEIKMFYNDDNLDEDLDYLTKCGYLKLEHPKDLVVENNISKREYREDLEKGYNLVAGKLSYPISTILDPEQLVPTIVATEAGKIAVSTPTGVRSITVAEGLAFSGFPSSYTMASIKYKDAFDLLGNTVMPPVISYVSTSLLNARSTSNVLTSVAKAR